jgi:hypothetical protein
LFKTALLQRLEGLFKRLLSSLEKAAAAAASTTEGSDIPSKPFIAQQNR